MKKICLYFLLIILTQENACASTRYLLDDRTIENIHIQKVVYRKGKRASSIGGSTATEPTAYGKLYARRGNNTTFRTIAAIIAPNAILTTSSLVRNTLDSLAFTTAGQKYRPTHILTDIREKKNGGVPIAILVFNESISSAQYNCRSLSIGSSSITKSGNCFSISKERKIIESEGELSILQSRPERILNPKMQGFGRLVIEEGYLVGFSTNDTSLSHGYGENSISSRRLTKEMVAWIQQALAYAPLFLTEQVRETTPVAAPAPPINRTTSPAKPTQRTSATQTPTEKTRLRDFTEAGAEEEKPVGKCCPCCIL